MNPDKPRILTIKAKVKRDGKWVNPAARELVPGNAIRVLRGDIVPRKQVVTKERTIYAKLLKPTERAW